MKTLLSLYDYSGNWSYPFAAAGWNVVLWDIKHEADNFTTFSDIGDACAEFIHEHIFDNYGMVDGILIAQPCTEFAVSGARWFKQKDEDGRTEAAVELVYQSLRIVNLCKPDFWALENPISRIHKLVPELGDPAMYFQPWHYGDPYTKKTALWGNFNTNLIRNEVEPTEGNRTHQFAGNSANGKEKRSETPMGFAQAFFEANKDFVYDHEQDEIYI